MRMLRNKTVQAWHWLAAEHKAIGALAALLGVFVIFGTGAFGLYSWIVREVIPPQLVTYRLPTNEDVMSFLTTTQAVVPFRGRIVSSDGAPVEGALVSFLGADPIAAVYLHSRVGQRTDKYGRFEVGYVTERAPQLRVWLPDSKPVRLVTEQRVYEGFGPVRDDNYTGLYVTKFDVGFDFRDVSFAKTRPTNASDLYVERVLIRGEPTRTETAIYEFSIRNPSDKLIRVTNIGLLFKRDEEGVAKACCCPTGEPYNYILDLEKKVDESGVSVEFSDFLVETLTDDSPQRRLTGLAKVVSRQWCRTGIMAVSFPVDVPVDKGVSQKVRLIFPERSVFRLYKYRLVDKGTLELPNMTAGVNGTPTPLTGYLTFDVFMFDELSKLIKAPP